MEFEILFIRKENFLARAYYRTFILTFQKGKF